MIWDHVDKLTQRQLFDVTDTIFRSIEIAFNGTDGFSIHDSAENQREIQLIKALSVELWKGDTEIVEIVDAFSTNCGNHNTRLKCNFCILKSDSRWAHQEGEINGFIVINCDAAHQ